MPTRKAFAKTSPITKKPKKENKQPIIKLTAGSLIKLAGKIPNNPEVLSAMVEITPMKRLIEHDDILKEAYKKQPVVILNAAIVLAEDYPEFLKKIFSVIENVEKDLNREILRKLRNQEPETVLQRAMTFAVKGKHEALIIILEQALSKNFQLKIPDVEVMELLKILVWISFNTNQENKLFHLICLTDNFNSLDVTNMISKGLNLPENPYEKMSKIFPLHDTVLKCAVLGYPKLLMTQLKFFPLFERTMKSYSTLALTINQCQKMYHVLGTLLSLSYHHKDSSEELTALLLSKLPVMGFEPKKIFSYTNPLLSAIFNNDLKTVNEMCDNDLAQKMSNAPMISIVSACNSNKMEIALQLIQYSVSKGVDVNSHEYSPQRSVLSHFAANGYVEGVEVLLKMGADVNERFESEDGATILHTVMRQSASLANKKLEFLQILKNLLAHGANINAQDKNGNTPFHILLNESCGIPHRNTHYFNDKLFKYMLIHGSDLTLQNNAKISIQDLIDDKNRKHYAQIQSSMAELKEDNTRFVASTLGLLQSLQVGSAVQLPHEIVSHILTFSEFSEYRCDLEIQKQVEGLFIAWNEKRRTGCYKGMSQASDVKPENSEKEKEFGKRQR